MRVSILPILLLLMVSAAVRAEPAPIPPAPTRWVTDTVGFMTPATRARLDGRLERYERDTGHQILVWAGDSIGDGDLADWAVRTFAAWKPGRKGADDGLVMFILAKDRQIDIEVGYGLEGQVPDAVASRIIREVMAPRLRADDRDGAVSAGVDAILAAIEGRPVEDRAPGASDSTARGLATPQNALYGLLLLVFLGLLIFNPRLAMLFLMSVSGRGGGGLGGAGGSGGGFSGGGGRSGGGGGRGSW